MSSEPRRGVDSAIGEILKQVRIPTELDGKLVTVLRAALNRRRLELWNEQSDRLRGLIPKALDCVESFLEGGSPADKLRASLGILRATPCWNH